MRPFSFLKLGLLGLPLILTACVSHITTAASAASSSRTLEELLKTFD
jgi:hypothetical protein